MSDTPRVFCPGCEPEADQIAEMLETLWCGTHLPVRAGADDALVTLDSLIPIASESAQNRAFCALLHREHAEPE